MPSKTKPAVSAGAAKKELSTTNYVAAVIAVTLVIVIVCGLAGKGMVGSLIVNTKVIAAKVKAKSDLDTKLSNIPTLLQNYQNLGDTKRVIADGLPNDADFPQLISIMQGIGNASGVTVSSISSGVSTTSGAAGSAPAAAPTSPTTTGGPTPSPFSITVTAPYAQMLRFFHNLEISDRPIHVTSAQFSGQSSSISVNLSLLTYYQGKADISDTTETIK